MSCGCRSVRQTDGTGSSRQAWIYLLSQQHLWVVGSRAGSSTGTDVGLCLQGTGGVSMSLHAVDSNQAEACVV